MIPLIREGIYWNEGTNFVHYNLGYALLLGGMCYEYNRGKDRKDP